MITESKFSPTWWLRNPHLQTILASKLLRPASVQTRRERVELEDGDFIDINLGLQPQSDIVAIFHGLAGCVESSYAQGAIGALQQAGRWPIFMHWRGCSGEPNRLARAYHSGSSDDIAWLIQYLHEQFPEHRLHALGFSLGANALLKYLGESGRHSGLHSALAIAPPLVLEVGANRLSRGLSRGYQRYLLNLARTQHERKRVLYPALNLPEAGPELSTFWQFDNVITAPLHGFDDVHDYYRQCGARQYLGRIRTPTHILCALDDPFFGREIVPAASELSDCTTLELSRYGGHVGFVYDQSGTQRWLDRQVAAFFSQRGI